MQVQQSTPSLSFLAAVKAGSANLDQVDVAIDKWHDSKEDHALHEYLGLTPAQHAIFMMRANSVIDVAFQAALQQATPGLYLHLESTQLFLTIGEGRMALDNTAVMLYIGVDGKLRVREIAQFQHRHFSRYTAMWPTITLTDLQTDVSTRLATPATVENDVNVGELVRYDFQNALNHYPPAVLQDTLTGELFLSIGEAELDGDSSPVLVLLTPTGNFWIHPLDKLKEGRLIPRMNHKLKLSLAVTVQPA